MELRKETVASRLAATLVGALLLTIPLWAEPTAGAPSHRQGTVQDLESGKVSGSEVNDGATLLWLGIPYAEPPVGALRLKAPQPLAASSGSFDATRGDALCPQLQAGKLVGSEDCLTLDIYRPNSPETGLPVLVYIHGGNNQGGTSQELDAKHLAVTVNAAVVSVNSRLGLPGFNGLPALKTGSAEENSGNVSLLDISQLGESATSGPSLLVVDANAEKAVIEMTEERMRYDDVLAQMEADGSIPEVDKRDLIENVLNGRWFSRRLDRHFGNGSP